MKRAEIPSLYVDLAARINGHVPLAAYPISVKFPIEQRGELAFFRLVTWAYVMLLEAARTPCSFLGELVPDEDVRNLRQEVGRLRTYISHNLVDSSKWDRKTLEFLRLWFREACKKDFPECEDDYDKCVDLLLAKLVVVLKKLMDASELLGDSVDGPRLVEDLAVRVSRDWPAHKFDELLAEIVGELGVGFVDVRALREKRLSRWREALSVTAIGEERAGVASRIRADVTEIFGLGKKEA